jgi:hypothetical protein
MSVDEQGMAVGKEAQMLWQQGIDWSRRVDTVIKYYLDKPYLKFGPWRRNIAFPLIDNLCAQGEVTRAALMEIHGLDSHDDILTILSNVTMAIQGAGGGQV